MKNKIILILVFSISLFSNELNYYDDDNNFYEYDEKTKMYKNIKISNEELEKKLKLTKDEKEVSKIILKEINK